MVLKVLYREIPKFSFVRKGAGRESPQEVRFHSIDTKRVTAGDYDPYLPRHSRVVRSPQAPTRPAAATASRASQLAHRLPREPLAGLRAGPLGGPGLVRRAVIHSFFKIFLPIHFCT